MQADAEVTLQLEDDGLPSVLAEAKSKYLPETPTAAAACAMHRVARLIVLQEPLEQGLSVGSREGARTARI